MRVTDKEEDSLLEPPPFWDDAKATGKPIDLLSLLGLMAARWPLFLTAGTLGGVLCYGFSFLLTPRYSSTAVFLPPPQRLSATDNPLSLLMKAPPSAIYTGLLMSESVITDVVKSTNLQASFKAKDLEAARIDLRKITSVSTETSGFVTLQVTHQDPKLARDIATNFLRALSRLNDRLAVSEASQQRTIFQAELEAEKNELENAEVELKKLQETSGVVAPENQTLAALYAIEGARAEVRSRQVALAAVLQGATEQSPDVVRLRSEIAAQETQLRRLQSGAATVAPGGILSAAQAPSVNLRFVKLAREVKYHQVLFDLIAKQFENSKLQEASAAPGVQVVDFPELPMRKSFPQRRLFALVGAVGGFLFIFTRMFMRNRLEALRQDPERAQALETFRRSLKGPKLRF